MNNKSYKILVADKLSEQSIDYLKQIVGFDIDVKVGLSSSQLAEIIENYDCLLIRSATKVDEQILAKAKRLRVIGRAGIGVDNVDVDCASQAGVVVMNTPHGNTVTTAEHALALLFAMARKIPQATSSLKSGKWEKSSFQGVELSDKTLGIIGLGQIGQIVAKKASGLGLNVVAYDTMVTANKAQECGTKLLSLPQLYAQSDFISIHLPLNKSTKGIINKSAFAQMKDGVYLIHAARGGIVIESDLLQALQDGKVAAAALDVFETEPLPANHPLLSHNNVIVTPHLGASTKEAQTRVSLQIAQQVHSFLLHGQIENAVNVPNMSKNDRQLLEPLINMGHVLGKILGQYIVGKASKIEIEIESHYKNCNLSPIAFSSVAGYISAKTSDDIEWIKAPSKASAMGIEIVENYIQKENTDLNPSITIKIDDNNITGTLFSNKGSRVVELNGFDIEFIPSRYMLLLNNEDKPGVIGTIGTILGQQQINVSRMQLGSNLDGRAISIWNLQKTLSKEQLAQLCALEYVLSAQMIHL